MARKKKFADQLSSGNQFNLQQLAFECTRLLQSVKNELGQSHALVRRLQSLNNRFQDLSNFDNNQD